MTPVQLIAALESLLAIRQPVFIWGPPGVGKSQIVAQVAKKTNRALKDIRAVLLDPVDLRGLPRITQEGQSVWCPPAFLPGKDDPKEGILFLDELNAAPPLVQAACYQLILDRSIGEYTLPDGWAIVAAGNREKDKAVTHRMPSALANRMVHLEVEPSLDDWLNWAQLVKIRPEVCAFLRFRPKLLHDFDPRVSTGKAFASPRTWEFISRILEVEPASNIEYELYQGTVGEIGAAEFMGFLGVWRELPTVESILENPSAAVVPAEPAALYALCEALSTCADDTTINALTEYAERLPAEFGVLLIRDAICHNTGLVNTEAFSSWAEKNAEVLCNSSMDYDSTIPSSELNILQKAYHAMIRARAALVMDHPFFGSLVLRLNFKEDASCHDLWTDGKTLGYNPLYAATLPEEKLIGAQAHEVLHLAFLHHVRRKDRNEERWNKACDLAINQILLDSGFLLPKGFLHDPKYVGLSADDIYDILTQLADEQAKGGAKEEGQAKPSQEEASEGASGSITLEKDEDESADKNGLKESAENLEEGKDRTNAGKDQKKQQENNSKTVNQQEQMMFSGEVRDHPGLLENTNDLAQNKAHEEAGIALTQAMQRALGMGSLPAGLARVLTDVFRPQLDWRELLQRFIESCADNDYSWSVPNRRYVHQGIYLPSRHEARLKNIALAVDSSGSIDEKELALFCSELSTILEVYETNLTVLFHDTQVQAEQMFSRMDLPLDLTPRGGGGTDFKPVCEYIADHEIYPACLIWFTDMECSSFPSEPNYPVLWVCTRKHFEKPPFGDVITFPVLPICECKSAALVGCDVFKGREAKRE